MFEICFCAIITCVVKQCLIKNISIVCARMQQPCTEEEAVSKGVIVLLV